MSLSYKKIIKHMAAQAPKVYGEIPPLAKKQNKKKKKKNTVTWSRLKTNVHVEDWIVVDSKESLPDEEDLVQQSPLRNFLSIDFFSDVLPLHTPPASLSDPSSVNQQNEIAALTNRLKATRLPPNIDIITPPTSPPLPAQEKKEITKPPFVRRHSISSTTNAQIPSLSTTTTPFILTDEDTDGDLSASLPPPSSTTTDHVQQIRWLQTISRLRQSLVHYKKENNKRRIPDHLIPMPPPPPKPGNQRRRSEATTQPRFNAETNTYKRDTRYNSDHLRIISCELNMMRHRKLISPLRPRGFLPRRKDPFICGDGRLRSPLVNQVYIE
ncbi:unnamed protein product [Absidia cylindrospora]